MRKEKKHYDAICYFDKKRGIYFVKTQEAQEKSFPTFEEAIRFIESRAVSRQKVNQQA